MKLKYPNNSTCAYLNINCISNELESLTAMLEENIDILCIAETKVYSSYQFHLPGYRTPCRLDVNANSGGIMVYIRETSSSRVLKDFTLPSVSRICLSK